MKIKAEFGTCCAFSRGYILRPFNLSLIGLAVAVTLWGFAYELSLYHPREAQSSRSFVAKMRLGSESASATAKKRAQSCSYPRAPLEPMPICQEKRRLPRRQKTGPCQFRTRMSVVLQRFSSSNWLSSEHLFAKSGDCHGSAPNTIRRFSWPRNCILPQTWRLRSARGERCGQEGLQPQSRRDRWRPHGTCGARDRFRALQRRVRS